MNRIHVALTDAPLNASEVSGLVRDDSKGGIAVFLGDVRATTRGKVTHAITYEAYESMALKAMQTIAETEAEAAAANVAIVHRIGNVPAGETSVICAAACTHRADAFECCRKLIDRLKEEVPIWKKESGPDGDAWVEP